MADIMVVEVEELKKPEMKGPDQEKKCLKRKRCSMKLESLSTEDRESRMGDLRKELDGLFKYYQEVLEQKKKLGLGLGLGECGSSNSVIACLLEESCLPLSKLVNEIYEKMKGIEGFDSITIASVKSSVLLIGQRSLYGLPNSDADVLEDDTESSLWCWETKDVKMMPKSVRGALKIWRTCRKKIHDRISAVSEMIIALQKSENHRNCKQELMKASERLGKVLTEADIRLLIQRMIQKNGADMAQKEVELEKKLLVKQLERNKREVEKEKKRMDLELQKEKLHSEKELKRLRDEAEKEERRREKEESEMMKQLRKQQEEAEKDQRRREKEEAELKKQLSLQKQASLMQRFLKRSKKNLTSQNDQSSSKAIDESSLNRIEKMPESITLSMDSALSLKDGINTDDIWKSHLISWRCSGHSIRSNKKQHWSIRRKPKTELVKELKLTTCSGPPCDDELSLEKPVDGFGEANIDGRSCHTNADGSLPTGQKCNWGKQLLQFDKSHRPAFYGIWPKKSQVVGPRHPFVKDLHLDYEIDSDEEWEEEEPGESLSDCDKDDEEECLEEGYSKADEEDESEDGFFVPDGYLSENEGVQEDRIEYDQLVEEARSSLSCKHVVESEELCVLFRQRKYLHNLTEQALRKNQPLIILNLMHEKTPMVVAEDLTGTLELEQMCLKALSMCAFPSGPSIEISVDVQEEDQEASLSTSKGSTTPVATAAAIQDSDLLQIVSVIQSCSQGINKVVESLHHKLPTISKSQLRNKVREISDFMDGRWQVKKDILHNLGLSTSPEKGGGRTKSIATFFSKRCLPPAGKTVNPNETSPQSSQKPPASAVQQTAAEFHI